MFLSGSFVGGTFLPSIPLASTIVTYDKLEVNGELIVDKIRILSENLTDTAIQSLRPTDEYVWEVPTTMLLYAEFNDDLSAGNIGGFSDPATGLKIFRKESTESRFDLLTTIPIAEINAGKQAYDDYTVVTGKTYDYRLYVETDTELSEPINTDPFTTDFFYWSLTNPVTEQVFLFDLNMSSGNITSNKDLTVYNQAYTAKPAVSFSDKDYITGSINCMAGQAKVIDSLTEFYYPIDYLDDLKDFINDKSEKYLKSRRGDIWKVVTSGFGSNYIDETGEQLANIQFNFTEVGEF